MCRYGEEEKKLLLERHTHLKDMCKFSEHATKLSSSSSLVRVTSRAKKHMKHNFTRLKKNWPRVKIRKFCFCTLIRGSRGQTYLAFQMSISHSLVTCNFSYSFFFFHRFLSFSYPFWWPCNRLWAPATSAPWSRRSRSGTRSPPPSPASSPPCTRSATWAPSSSSPTSAPGGTSPSSSASVSPKFGDAAALTFSRLGLFYVCAFRCLFKWRS